MSSPATKPKPEEGARSDAAWALFVAMVALGVQLGLYLGYSLVPFRKYTVAAAQALRGDLPDERLLDFSPFYLELAVLARRIFENPEPWLSGLHFALLAVASGAFFLLCRRRFSLPLALLGAGLLIFDRHVL
ncbi:MAG: hypothetical protein MI919_35250, partial [Holophagales bacterium]|nr:hypothetical protein [Holophagales bacterium]